MNTKATIVVIALLAAACFIGFFVAYGFNAFLALHGFGG